MMGSRKSSSGRLISKLDIWEGQPLEFHFDRGFDGISLVCAIGIRLG